MNKIKIEYSLDTGSKLEWFSTNIPEDTPTNKLKEAIIKSAHLSEFYFTKADIKIVRLNY